MTATATSTGAAARPLAAIGCMAFAALLYSGFDAITKWLVVDFSPIQILFFRGLFAFLPWLAWVAREPESARLGATAQPGLQVLRGLLGFAAVSCFALAFRFLPLAVAVAIAYSAPLFTTALARPLLGEAVSPARWLIVAVGFAGVLVMTRPGTGAFQAGVGWALAGAILYALTSIATRHLGGTNRAATTMLYSMSTFVVLGGALLPFVWQAPAPGEWTGFVAIGLVGGVAQYFLLQAYRLAPASTVSPFEYTILAWSVVWGLLVWHELPDALSVLGMVIIAGAGLALVRQERGRAATGHAPGPS